MRTTAETKDLAPDPCPNCGEVHVVCACGRARVLCPPDEPGEPFTWCEVCEAEYHTNTVLARIDKPETGKAESRERFLSHVRTLIDYWDASGWSKRHALEGLAFSLLVALDGCSAVLPAYALIPDGEGLPGSIAGSLHSDLLRGKLPLA